MEDQDTLKQRPVYLTMEAARKWQRLVDQRRSAARAGYKVSKQELADEVFRAGLDVLLSEAAATTA